MGFQSSTSNMKTKKIETHILMVIILNFKVFPISHPIITAL